MFNNIKKKMFNNIRRKMKKADNQKGFTLLEILVVLTIMGFLIAMVAPRLAGISGSAVDTVCDSNQNRMVTYMSSYFEQTNRYPDMLTNLVITDGLALLTATYQIPTASNADPADGQEVLSDEFYSRNHFYAHYLNDAEREEIIGMGIANLLNLNDYSGIGTLNQPNDVAVVAAAAERASMEIVALTGYDITGGDLLAVAMVGYGANAAGAFASSTVERDWGEPDWFGRIVLGMGTECGLITSGVISNAAHCPGGIQNADNVIYNDYNLVLPRLEATAARVDGMAPIGTILTPTTLGCVAYDDAPIAAYDYGAGANAANLRVRTYNVTEAQEKWQFATQCPEGHMYPADDEEFWGVDIDNLTGIN